ncbi:MAG: hybrid sensor histidine kinase/response regulator [Chloroflexi bacterium]|nr:hybrid sensor histidine kinase/response regulator [Chloroflexota bacterium]
MDQISGSILVVDDNVVIRQILRAALEKDGHVIKTVTSGREALRQLNHKPYDLVLLDVVMPDIDGIELLEIMQHDKTLSLIPVIIISGDDQMESTIRCIELGAIDYLGKPINMILLKARVQVCLQKKRFQDQAILYQQELEKMYGTLQKANEMKSDFVAFVAHELRSPLSSLWAYKDLLPRFGQLSPKQESLLQNMNHSLERMRLLVTDLDDISRIEQGNLTLNFSSVHVHKIIHAVVADEKHHIVKKAQIVTINVPEGLPFVYADQDRLVQILINLVNNAVKYTPISGQIHITAVPSPQDPSFVQIAIKDSGIGIPESEQEKIFEKYFRVESSMTEEIPGSGLGLNIVHSLIEKHGGSIWVESKARQGSTFFFTLPFANETNWSQSLVNDTVQLQTLARA